MSDRRAWLDESCPRCWVAPGARCRADRYSPRKHPSPGQILHIARGWRERACPTCEALSGELCRTPSGHQASQHAARLRAGCGELACRAAVWEELERRGAAIAAVPFLGRAGGGGRTGTITLSRLDGDELIEVERWSARDELALALEGPRLGSVRQFAGHPRIRGTLTWTVAERCIRGGVGSAARLLCGQLDRALRGTRNGVAVVKSPSTPDCSDRDSVIEAQRVERARRL